MKRRIDAETADTLIDAFDVAFGAAEREGYRQVEALGCRITVEFPRKRPQRGAAEARRA